MLTGPQVILTLKIAVAALTVLWLLSLAAIMAGRRRLHGRLNVVFFALTVIALVGLETLIRFVAPEMFSYLQDDPGLKQALSLHLSFALPAAAIMPIMLFTGLARRRLVHLSVATVFSIFWIGTFITGVLFLPHAP